MTTIYRLTGIISLLLLLAVPLGAATIYVPDDHATIQGAIQAAVQGDVIRVRPGTYLENIDFLGKAITVSSLQGPASTVIDAGYQGAVAVFFGGEGPASVLRGFTLTNGIGYFDELEERTFGGGVYCLESSPTIDNCQIENNTADLGGGMFCESGAPAITGCEFEENEADSGGGLNIHYAAPRVSDCSFTANSVLYGGGGIKCVGGSPTITGCLFSNNETTVLGAGGGGGIGVVRSSPVITDNQFKGNRTAMGGGGFACSSESEPIIIGNVFEYNEARSGGAISIMVSRSALISGNHCIGNQAELYGGGISTSSTQTVISDNTLSGNTAGTVGGGIHFVSPPIPGGHTDIRRNLIENNSAHEGGGIHSAWGELRLTECRISGNSATYGGGVMLDDHDGGIMANCAIHDNQATRGGGMLINLGGTLTLVNNTVTANSADQGGGIFCLEGTTLSVVHGIFWDNSAPEGKEIYLDYDPLGLSLSIEYSDVEGGIGSLEVEPGCTLSWGEGMIDADPLFTSGPGGTLYLSQTAAGQPVNSPCVDAGDPSAGGASGTTRSDAFSDVGIVDLGAHHLSGSLVAGAGPGVDNPPLVRLFPAQQDAAHDLEFPAYGADSYGINVHAGDLDGDGLDEIITGAGPGEVYGPHVRGFGSDGQPIPGVSFLAYATNRFGVNVAAGDIDGDGRDEIVTGAGPGEVFGPHVRAFDVNEFPLGTTAIPGVSFMAYSTHRWGVNVACGDIDGDGFDEIVTGAGPGAVFGPHVRGWNVDNASSAAIPAVSYFAYGTQKYGVRVSCGDVDGDGIDEIITAPGPSSLFGPHIRGWNYDGAAVAPIAGCSFFALPPAQYSYGAQLFAGTDLDGDGRAELVVGAGPGPGADSAVVVYRYDGAAVSQWLSLLAMPSSWRHGATVAAGHF